jgi:predicted DCC family thiol-disulfide oxidoreductase YuxK
MDKQKKLSFSALQGQLAKELIATFLPAENEVFTTMIFFKAGKVHTNSTAAIEIAHTLGGFWKIAILAYIFPRFLRDWVYNILSKNRYRWFGKQDSCWMPTPELKSRFL